MPSLRTRRRLALPGSLSVEACPYAEMGDVARTDWEAIENVIRASERGEEYAEALWHEWHEAGPASRPGRRGDSRARATPAQPSVYVIDHVADGDTVVLRNGQTVRLVQIDTPEVYFGTECYGPRRRRARSGCSRGYPRPALAEPATDRVDGTGGCSATSSAQGWPERERAARPGRAAAPYFYLGRRGRYATLLERLALRARAKKLGLWGRCPHTP